MFAKGLAEFIGREGTLRVDSLRFAIIIKDARSLYGRTDFLVAPASGEGEQWVSNERVSIFAV